jgi:hypothetical protein
MRYRKSKNIYFIIRNATKEDCGLILGFIKELAEYEKLAHEVITTIKILEQSLFGETPYAKVVIREISE